MFHDCLADRSCESHGHRVPNHPPDPLEFEVGTPAHELVLLGERLQQRTLPQGEAAILLWMAEATIAETEDLRRDRGRWFVPFHATIDARIVRAGLFLVAVGAKFTGPVAPGASGFRDSDASQVSSGKSAAPVERVGFRRFTRVERRKLSQHVGDSAMFARAVRWRHEFNRPQARCEDDYPATMLGNPVVRAGHHPLLRLLCVMEALLVEDGHELVKYLVRLELGYVLHAHDVWFQLANEPTEVSEQSPFRIAVILEPFSVLAQRLARCAANEDARVPFRVVTRQIAAREFGDAFQVEPRSTVVAFVRQPALRIDVVTGRYVHAPRQETAGQPTRSAKEVNRGRSNAEGACHFCIHSIRRAK